MRTFGYVFRKVVILLKQPHLVHIMLCQVNMVLLLHAISKASLTGSEEHQQLIRGNEKIIIFSYIYKFNLSGAIYSESLFRENFTKPILIGFFFCLTAINTTSCELYVLNKQLCKH
jgi:hypothetical protein